MGLGKSSTLSRVSESFPTYFVYLPDTVIHLISFNTLNTRCITICTLQFACLETLLRPYLLELETLERCLVRALQPGALVHTGTTGDNGGRGQETQERSAQGFWAESTFLTSSNTFPVFEECLADVKEPTQLQSFKNNENNDLERVKSFFRKAVAPWKSCSHCSLCSSHFYKLS